MCFSKKAIMYWRPGPVVLGGDSCQKGCVFESKSRILDGLFMTFICWKFVPRCWSLKIKDRN